MRLTAAIHLDGVWHWWLGCQGGWRHLKSKTLVDWHTDLLPVTGQGGDTGSVSKSTRNPPSLASSVSVSFDRLVVLTAVTPSGIYSFLPGCGGICRRVASDRSMDSWGPAAAAKLNGPGTIFTFNRPICFVCISDDQNLDTGQVRRLTSVIRRGPSSTKMAAGISVTLTSKARRCLGVFCVNSERLLSIRAQTSAVACDVWVSSLTDCDQSTKQSAIACDC